MSLTKLFLDGNIESIPVRPGRVWYMTPRLGTGKWQTFFYSVMATVPVVSQVNFSRTGALTTVFIVQYMCMPTFEIPKFFIKVLLLGKAMFAVLYCISVKLKLKGELTIQLKCLVSC
jgi:hypothetical protein